MMCGRRLARPSAGAASALPALLEAAGLHRLLPAAPSRRFTAESRRVPQFCFTAVLIRLLHPWVTGLRWRRSRPACARHDIGIAR